MKSLAERPVWCEGMRTTWAEMYARGKHIDATIEFLTRSDAAHTIAIMSDGSKVQFDRDMLRHFNPVAGDSLEGWSLPYSSDKVSCYYKIDSQWKTTRVVYTRPKTAEEKQLEYLRDRVKAVMRSI